ncbi:NADH-ubiquinone oxidoreductase-like [Tropilaelaps mercedesae]|uniref:NADH dehydrogenase [ubiquinone] 1 alpha subcomplex subunit 6 n=1 Tax=Tropilaelaps mercedesae TaxID=418985 RepID=A0A1V9XWJ4_9ACAR|nr:NADH-ubiquinone oxidoreductase-like [Tropilaelaps mercedesae]
MSSIVKQSLVKVKPIMSTSMPEARRRAKQLYKAWYREMPSIVKKYDIPVTAEQGRLKLRENFEKNRNIRDVRTIDMLVIKMQTTNANEIIQQGQMELVETMKLFKQKSHVMAFFKDTVPEKPKDFLSKFLDGH